MKQLQHDIVSDLFADLLSGSCMWGFGYNLMKFKMPIWLDEDVKYSILTRTKCVQIYILAASLQNYP